MLTVDLEPIPNQRVNFVGDGQQYQIVLRDNDDVMFMDITMNGATVITSMPCLVGQIVNPYAYLEGLGGNFIFNTASGDNPQYENFDAGDTLLYITNAELASARATNAANATQITLAPNQAP